MGIGCQSGTSATSEIPPQGVRVAALDSIAEGGLRSCVGTPREAGDRPAEEGHHLKTIIGCLWGVL